MSLEKTYDAVTRIEPFDWIVCQSSLIMKWKCLWKRAYGYDSENSELNIKKRKMCFSFCIVYMNKYIPASQLPNLQCESSRRIIA